MPRQTNNWACSACSLAWIERATGLNVYANQISATEEIGYPENINATYGLMNGSGIELQRVLSNYNQLSRQKWSSFDEIYTAAEQTTGMMAGGSWYHWVAIRGVTGNSLWIANSSPGWRGVYDVLSREQFNQLGPFSVVYLL